VQVVAVALEERVVGDLDDDVQIARRAAERAGLALAREAESLAGGNSRRDLDRNLAQLLDGALTATGVARLGDDPTAAATLAAGPRNRKEPLLIAQLARPPALRTRRRRGPGGRA
jgi:hypothetical protein